MAEEFRGAKPKTESKGKTKSESANSINIVLEPKKTEVKGKHKVLTDRKSKSKTEHPQFFDDCIVNQNSTILKNKRNINVAPENFQNIKSPIAKSTYTADFESIDGLWDLSLHTRMEKHNLGSERNHTINEHELNGDLVSMSNLEDSSPMRKIISVQNNSEYLSAKEKWKKSGMALRKYIAGKLGIKQKKYAYKHKLDEDMRNNVLCLNTFQNAHKETNCVPPFRQPNLPHDRKLLKHENPTRSQSVGADLHETVVKKALPQSKSFLQYLGLKKGKGRHVEQSHSLTLSKRSNLCESIDENENFAVDSNPIFSLSAGDSYPNFSLTENVCNINNKSVFDLDMSNSSYTRDNHVETKRKCKKAKSRQSDASHIVKSGKNKSKDDEKKKIDTKHGEHMPVTVNNNEKGKRLRINGEINNRDLLRFLDDDVNSTVEFGYDANNHRTFGNMRREITDDNAGELMGIHHALPLLPLRFERNIRFPNDCKGKSHENGINLNSVTVSNDKKSGNRQAGYYENPRKSNREFEARNSSVTRQRSANNSNGSLLYKPTNLCISNASARHNFGSEANKLKFGIFQNALNIDADEESDKNVSFNKKTEHIFTDCNGFNEELHSHAKDRKQINSNTEIDDWRLRLNELDMSDDYRTVYDSTVGDNAVNARHANVAMSSGMLDLVQNIDEPFLDPYEDLFFNTVTEDSKSTREKSTFSLLDNFSRENVETESLSTNGLFGQSSNSLFESTPSSASVSTQESLVAAHGFNCDCVHCRLLGRHDSSLSNHGNDGGQIDFTMYPRFGFAFGIDRETAHANFFGTLPFIEEPGYETYQSYNDLDWLIIDSTPLAFMLEDVIQHMLALRPELLNEHASPPAAATVIDNIPTIELNVSHVEQHPICPICLIESEIADVMSQLPCQHIFHPLCIRAWLVKSGTCPVCRQVVTVDNRP